MGSTYTGGKRKIRILKNYFVTLTETNCWRMESMVNQVMIDCIIAGHSFPTLSSPSLPAPELLRTDYAIGKSVFQKLRASSASTCLLSQL